jgi:hypothetical protein
VKLKRSYPVTERAYPKDIPGKSTKGLWRSRDDVWLFCQGRFCPYGIGHASLPHHLWFIAPGLQKEYEAKEKFLKTYGLWAAAFPTRREAMKALESVLEGMVL